MEETTDYRPQTSDQGESSSRRRIEAISFELWMLLSISLGYANCFAIAIGENDNISIQFWMKMQEQLAARARELDTELDQLRMDIEKSGAYNRDRSGQRFKSQEGLTDEQN